MVAPSLSSRGRVHVGAPIRIDMEATFEAGENLYDPETNPTGAFPLNVAENKLGLAELKTHLRQRISETEIPDWVAGYTAMLGAPDVRQTIATFLERYLTGCPIDSELLGFSAGASSAIEMTAFILADPGDVAVFPVPSYPVYAKDVGNFGGMERYDLHTYDSFDALAREPMLTIQHLEDTLADLESQGKRFRMLVVTNPNNPTGGLYPEHVVRAAATWCIEHEIHMVVNEIYGLSRIDTSHPAIRDDYALDIAYSSFVPIMDEMASDYLHFWYAFSKDFGVSGFRFGMVYSLNRDFISAYNNLNLAHTVSNMAQWSMQLLLEDYAFLDEYLPRVRKRLTESYVVVVEHLRQNGVPYVPSRGGLFVWVDLGAFVCEDTREAENELWLELYQATGILLTPGSGFGHRGYGQFRMVYPYVRKPALEVAMQRLAEFVTNKRKES